jgi:hypothetical protein
MKIISKISIFLLFIGIFIYLFNFDQRSSAGDKAGCEAFIYISNNSLFDCNLTVDDFGVGKLMIGKNKTYKVELLNDTPRKIKVKVAYQDPDYIFPRTFYLVTKEKIECGQTDSMYIAFTK